MILRSNCHKILRSHDQRLLEVEDESQCPRGELVGRFCYPEKLNKNSFTQVSGHWMAGGPPQYKIPREVGKQHKKQVENNFIW